MSAKKPSKREADTEQIRRLNWNLHTWGKLERAAGVTDRVAWWRERRGKSEDQISAELHQMATDRFRRGEIDVEGDPT